MSFEKLYRIRMASGMLAPKAAFEAAREEGSSVDRALAVAVLKFDPDQPRDESGKWTEGGGGGGGGTAVDHKAFARELKPHKFELKVTRPNGVRVYGPRRSNPTYTTEVSVSPDGTWKYSASGSLVEGGSKILHSGKGLADFTDFMSTRTLPGTAER
jgi:hypothetical protein